MDVISQTFLQPTNHTAVSPHENDFKPLPNRTQKRFFIISSHQPDRVQQKKLYQGEGTRLGKVLCETKNRSGSNREKQIFMFFSPDLLIDVHIMKHDRKGTKPEKWLCSLETTNISYISLFYLS